MSHVRLTPDELAALRERGWAASETSLEKTFAFGSCGDGLAFAVALGFAAEKRDHHPDLHIGWRKVGVLWSTHDAGGTTALDREMALATERLHAGFPGA
ncbi:MAG TPA: 4a-hydroxytetrahydrobiopterin dehydratase [Polyangiaceae bacterium]|nr:4a-hydroxytetrahydrobiopterin dehydratase [Polyangiaceae bacterium]